MKKAVLFFGILISLSSCTDSGREKEKQDSIQAIKETDSSQTELAKSYYTWYNDHMPELNTLNTVKNCPNNGDTTLVYRVDFGETEKWLSAFQSSGLVSENFIKTWREYFRKCDEEMIAEQAWDGPPAGFDYDFIYNSQEETPDNSQVKEAKFVKSELKNGKTIVTLAVPAYYDSLHTTIEKTPDGKWKVAE